MKHPNVGDILITDAGKCNETIVGMVMSKEDDTDDDAYWFKVMVPTGQMRDFFIPKSKRRKKRVTDATATATG